jgi:hypothetical protein
MAPPVSPVMIVLSGSVSKTSVSSSESGQSSTPRGTTKMSPGLSTTSRSLRGIVRRPRMTRRAALNGARGAHVRRVAALQRPHDGCWSQTRTSPQCATRQLAEVDGATVGGVEARASVNRIGLRNASSIRRGRRPASHRPTSCEHDRETGSGNERGPCPTVSGVRGARLEAAPRPGARPCQAWPPLSRYRGSPRRRPAAQVRPRPPLSA